MEVKCENCKYAVSNSGRPCREIVGRCSEYKEFVSVEEKPMEKVICDQNKNCNFPCNHRTEHNKNKECGKCAFQERECIPM